MGYVDVMPHAPKSAILGDDKGEEMVYVLVERYTYAVQHIHTRQRARYIWVVH